MIFKSGGGERQLGISTVLDRLIQQALLQVLQPRLDPGFSKHSHGFRPGRSAHGAVREARAYVQEGRRWVVDVDLEKFFDTVDHDVLMGRLAKRVTDRRVLALVRKYLTAGILAAGVLSQHDVGTPQGGPLSPLLANVLLDEVDKELERRKHAFVRYADDCNVYVRSERAGVRVMALLRRLFTRLHLRVNESKSAVALVWKRKFLGFSFWKRSEQVRVRVATQAIDRLSDRVRELTKRSRGVSLGTVCEDLRVLLAGWKNYFQLAECRSVFEDLDKWIRRRIRAFRLRQWRTARKTFTELRRLGLSPTRARQGAAYAGRWWRASDQAVHFALTNHRIDELGVPRLAA